MTEGEWRACVDPLPMLAFLDLRASDRKLRLFACACCRHAWNLLRDERGRRAVEVAERFADGQASDAERQAARYDIGMGFVRPREPGWFTVCGPQPWTACGGYHYAWQAYELFRLLATEAAWVGAWDDLGADQEFACRAQGAAWDQATALGASLIRDIFGNPFRPAVVDPAWETPAVLALAHGIYEERDFDRLPLLAAALMRAGCADETILEHCRGKGPHARGCWVVDLVLDKE